MSPNLNFAIVTALVIVCLTGLFNSENAITTGAFVVIAIALVCAQWILAIEAVGIEVVKKVFEDIGSDGS